MSLLNAFENSVSNTATILNECGVHCEMDEHQSLIDEQAGEWQDFEQCLRLWKRAGMDWTTVHDIPLPIIHCRTCRHYLDDFCGLYQREIPQNFNQANACKRWNE